MTENIKENTRENHFETIVNEKKKTVTVILKDCEYDAMNAILARYKFADDLDINYFGDLLLNATMMPKKFVGVAKCRDEDTFDEKEGRRIASKKAMEKHNKAFKNAIKAWQREMIKEIRNTNPTVFDTIK